MDERSRKLLSSEAKPKVDKPKAAPHEKREFKLPAGVGATPSNLAELRARALGKITSGSVPSPAAAAAGVTRKAAGSVPPPVAIMTIEPAPPVMPVPQVTVSVDAKADKKKDKKAKSGKTPKPEKKAAAPAGKAATLGRLQPEKKPAPPAPRAPIANPRPLFQTPVANPAPQAKATAVASDKTPAPLPPPPLALVPVRPSAVPPPLPPGEAAEGSSPIVIASTQDQPLRFREATSMWFERGDAEAAAAEIEAERDAAERAEAPGVLLGRFSRTQALVAAAGGVFALVILIAML